MGQKTVITQETIQKIEKGQNIGFYFAVCTLLFGAIAFLVLVPGWGFIFTAIFAVIIVLMLKNKKKRGKRYVYFIERPITQKFEETGYNDDDNETFPIYVFMFGNQRTNVFETEYKSKNVGDMYYVMYDAYDNRIMETYDTDKYALAAGLDVRALQ